MEAPDRQLQLWHVAAKTHSRAGRFLHDWDRHLAIRELASSIDAAVGGIRDDGGPPAGAGPKWLDKRQFAGRSSGGGAHPGLRSGYPADWGQRSIQ